MKKKLLFTAILIASLMLSACSSEDASSELSSAENTVTYSPIAGLYVDIPDDYSKVTGDYDIEYYQKNNILIMITSEYVSSPNDTAFNYAFYAMEQYANNFDEIKNHESFPLDVNNLDCYVNQFVYVMHGQSSDLEKYCYIAYIIHDDCVYIISCISPVSVFEFNKQDFENIVKSIEITD